MENDRRIELEVQSIEFQFAMNVVVYGNVLEFNLANSNSPAHHGITN